jgi:AraC-like DNA-binding protein
MWRYKGAGKNYRKPKVLHHRVRYLHDMKRRYPVPLREMTDNYPKMYLYKRIVQAKLFIDTHYCDSIELHNIADEASFSKFHFIRLFKTIYGNTPHQYLIKVRIENAKLLLQKNIPVTDACFSVGFESPASFSALFKRYTNSSPSQYQQEYLSRQQLIKKVPLKFIPNCFAEQKGWTKMLTGPK